MINIDEKSKTRKDSISVEFFFENTQRLFGIELLTDSGNLSRKIYDQNLHRPGLALAGFVDLFPYKRVQLLGNTELKYLFNHSDDEQHKILSKIFKFEIPCIIFSNNNEPPPVLIQLAEEYKIPLLSSHYTTTKLIYLVSDFLDDQFAERITIHGSFADVYGVGMLFTGKSGIGKSEVVLDLVERGHRLVADDVIILTKKGEGILMGAGTNIAKHFMEIRGLGIIDVERVFGIRAIRYQKRLEIVVELEFWNDDSEYTRTGLIEQSVNISGTDILYIKLPISPGKNITVISEVIALNYLLKHYGHDAAKIFQDRLKTLLKEENEGGQRGIDYFEHDFE
ncbi:MAG: HPr kinase/phosphorylase [Ignavibacterium sp.]|nr:MAG: HPr kinase/phosphorylase [Ignavibacterium sp.]